MKENMAENNGVYIRMWIGKDAIENIRNAMKNKTHKDCIGTLNLSIIIDGQGYAIPIKTTNYMNKQQIERLINKGKYDLDNGNIHLLYELKLVDTTKEDEPDLVCF